MRGHHILWVAILLLAAWIFYTHFVRGVPVKR